MFNETVEEDADTMHMLNGLQRRLLMEYANSPAAVKGNNRICIGKNKVKHLPLSIHVKLKIPTKEEKFKGSCSVAFIK